MRIRAALAASVLSLAQAVAQWSPFTGQWGKSDPSDLRVMTWNIKDALCSSNAKDEGATNWCAAARIVAAIRPDVLVLQETGDNTGNGTGSGVDSVATLQTVIDLFLHGGTDPFKGNKPVGSYVALYAPGYDLPYVFVSSETDSFNRNAVLSRYPFKDLNGDGKATISDIPQVSAHLYAPGGDGGIRGCAFVEIDLPDSTYAGDLVVGTAHLKAGSGGSNHQQRVDAAANVAYYVDHLLNGAGGTVPDPFGKIADSPPATKVLSPQTPVILAGDFNEDEATNGTRGPIDFLARAGMAGGTDGTDRDRSDSEWDAAADPFTGSTLTVSGAKFDAVIWQDSIATQRRAWTLHTSTMPPAAVPPELVGFPGGWQGASGAASDHRPVVSDLILPSGGAPGSFAIVSPAVGALHVPTTPTLEWTPSAGADTYTVHLFDDAGLTVPVAAYFGLVGTSVQVPAGTLSTCNDYYWRVTAVNGAGSTPASPDPAWFETVRPADINGDGVYDIFDFLLFTNLFNAGSALADFTGDGVLDIFDFLAFTNAFNSKC